MTELHYTLRKTLPNDFAFRKYAPHATVGYTIKGHRLRLPPARFWQGSATIHQLDWETPTGEKRILTL